MNKFAKALFITSAINIIVFLAGFIDPGFFLAFLAVVAIEFFGGLLLLIDKNSRQVAGGVITAAGVTFLIGLSICSTMTFIH